MKNDEDLIRRIASYNIEIVRRSSPLIQKVFNECRKKVGLDPIKFDDTEVK